MTKLKAMLQCTKVTFKLACFLIAAFMTITQILRYFENNDVSLVSFKRFNERPIDKYPTFTFCFYDDRGGIYSETVTELHVSKEEYSDLLKGRNVATNKSAEKFNRIVDEDYEMFTMKLDALLYSFAFAAKNANNTISFNHQRDKNDQVQITKSAFYISYQDPDQICFTRNSHLKTGTDFLRKEDKVLLDFYLLTVLKYLPRYLRIYIHYPGQFIRHKDIPAFEIALKELENKDYMVHFNLAYVSVLRKRSNENKPCNVSLENDDNEFKLNVMKQDQVRCIPLYWNSSITTNMPFGHCNTSNQLQDIYYYTQNIADSMLSYDPPCVKMQIPVNVRQETIVNFIQHPRVRISIAYSTEEYQEITNVKDFDFETMFSAVGGFIGIFLGYSLLQLPDLLDKNWKTYWMALINVCRGVKHACTLVTAYLFNKFGKFIFVQ